MNEQKEREKEMKTVTRRIVETEGGDGRVGGGSRNIEWHTERCHFSLFNVKSSFFNCIWVHPVRVRLKKTPRSTSNNYSKK